MEELLGSFISSSKPHSGQLEFSEPSYVGSKSLFNGVLCSFDSLCDDDASAMDPHNSLALATPVHAKNNIEHISPHLMMSLYSLSRMTYKHSQSLLLPTQ